MSPYVCSPHDNTPDLGQAIEFDIAEILKEYEPAKSEDLERLAAAAKRRPENDIGGPSVAHDVATEPRRRVQAMRDAA